jgi:integral membrane protein
MNSRQTFLWIARLEGLSFLVLLLIAMPMKYAFNQPLPVTYVGWAHGILFVLYFMALTALWKTEKWSFGKAFLAGTMSLVPFGTFWFEKNRL